MNRIRLAAVAALVAVVGVAAVEYASDEVFSTKHSSVVVTPTSDCPQGASLKQAILQDATDATRVEGATAECRGNWAIAEMVAYQEGDRNKKERIKLTLQKKDGVWRVVGDSPLTEYNAVVCQEAGDMAVWLECPSETTAT